MKKIAIQGVSGAFHEMAAQNYFKEENIEIIPCETFQDLFKSVEHAKADLAVMAIENVIAGSILLNYNLLRRYNFRIIGEIFMKIEQNLLALPGQNIKDITEVHSHHMAIAQTRSFFENHQSIQLIESTDTALSAREISENKIKERGAIASKLAAEKYQLEIVQEGIESFKKNQTRFLVIAPHGLKNTKTEVNKASLCFELSHKSGSLSQVLSILAYYDMNLTKIQSMPIMESEWEYSFYADLQFSNYENYLLALKAIDALCQDLIVMGEYASGKKITN